MGALTRRKGGCCRGGNISELLLPLCLLPLLPISPPSSEMSAADMMAMSELQDLQERAKELGFASGMGALSILR